MKFYPRIFTFISIWILAVVSIIWLSFYIVSYKNGTEFFLNSLSNWDGKYYLSIAQYGYQENSHFAFFPLYPLLVNLLSKLLQNYLLSAVLISVGSTILAFKLLFELIKQEFNSALAKKVILSLLIFPTSFYFLISYSEGLFFLLVVATFYFARKNLFLATIFAALACATKFSGVALALALIFETQLRAGFNRKNWYVLLSPLGLIFYCYYLYTQTGDPFYFLQAQQNWQRTPSFPYHAFWQNIQHLVKPGFIMEYPNFLVDLIFSIFGLGIIIRSFRFLPISYSVFGLISILIPLATGTLLSMPRLLLPIFPIFITLSLIKNEYINFGYQLFSILLLGVFILLFINGFWVA
jgi:hypothetical protein